MTNDLSGRLVDSLNDADVYLKKLCAKCTYKYSW